MLCFIQCCLEVDPGSLTLRALNDTKSAFVGVEFIYQYFASFQLAPELKAFSCKVNVKVRHTSYPLSI
jgi:hypothetical protein